MINTRIVESATPLPILLLYEYFMSSTRFGGTELLHGLQQWAASFAIDAKRWWLYELWLILKFQHNNNKI